MEQKAGRRAGQQGRDHPDLEAEDRDHGRDREQDRPGIDGAEHRDIEREAEALEMPCLPKPGVQREPDREIQDDADDRRGDAGERAAERLVVAQPFDERRAEPDKEEARHKGAPASRAARRACPPASAATLPGSR